MILWGEGGRGGGWQNYFCAYFLPRWLFSGSFFRFPIHFFQSFLAFKLFCHRLHDYPNPHPLSGLYPSSPIQNYPNLLPSGLSRSSPLQYHPLTPFPLRTVPFLLLPPPKDYMYLLSLSSGVHTLPPPPPPPPPPPTPLTTIPLYPPFP